MGDILLLMLTKKLKSKGSFREKEDPLPSMYGKHTQGGGPRTNKEGLSKTLPSRNNGPFVCVRFYNLKRKLSLAGGAATNPGISSKAQLQICFFEPCSSSNENEERGLLLMTQQANASM
jgi:hypothetical protein